MTPWDDAYSMVGAARRIGYQGGSFTLVKSASMEVLESTLLYY